MNSNENALQVLVTKTKLCGLKTTMKAVSYTHLRAHETVLDLVCRLLLENKKQHNTQHNNKKYISHNTEQHKL